MTHDRTRMATWLMCLAVAMPSYSLALAQTGDDGESVDSSEVREASEPQSDSSEAQEPNMANDDSESTTPSESSPSSSDQSTESETPDEFIPSQRLSEDEAVPFPVDI